MTEKKKPLSDKDLEKAAGGVKQTAADISAEANRDLKADRSGELSEEALGRAAGGHMDPTISSDYAVGKDSTGPKEFRTGAPSPGRPN